MRSQRQHASPVETANQLVCEGTYWQRLDKSDQHAKCLLCWTNFHELGTCRRMPKRSSMLASRKTRRYSTPLSMPTHLVMSIWFFWRSIPSGNAFEPSLASKFCFNSVGLKRMTNRKCAATDQVPFRMDCRRKLFP